MTTIQDVLRPRSLTCFQSLHPKAQPIFERWLLECHNRGVNVQITSGFRSAAEQDVLFAMGRTKPGKIITIARGTPAQSTHQFKAAVDTVIINPDGSANWDAKAYTGLWKVAQDLKLDTTENFFWAGLWTSFKESDHFQIGRSLDEVKQLFPTS